MDEPTPDSAADQPSGISGADVVPQAAPGAATAVVAGLPGPPFGQPAQHGFGYPDADYAYLYGDNQSGFSAEAPAGTNTPAKAAFVLGILGFFGLSAILAVVLGWIGLAQTRRTRQSGRGYAVAGLAFGATWLLLMAGGLVVTAVGGPSAPTRDSAGRITAAGRLAFLDLRVGDCYDDPNAGGGRSSLRMVTAQPCRRPHDAEAFARPTATGGAAYPGFHTLQDEADAGCAKALADYVYDDMSLPEGTQTASYVPQADAWAQGSRGYVCVLQSPRTLTRSLREDGTVLDADQVRYLKAVQEFNAQAKKIDEADPSASLGTWRALAADMAAVARREDDALAGPWPGQAQRDIANLVKAQSKALPLFDLATRAGSAYDAQDLLAQGLALVDSDDAYAARKALGLSTSQGQAPNTWPESA